MDPTDDPPRNPPEATEPRSAGLPAHAALIPHVADLTDAVNEGWYFAVMVRAAYQRLGAFD